MLSPIPWSFRRRPAPAPVSAAKTGARSGQ